VSQIKFAILHIPWRIYAIGRLYPDGTLFYAIRFLYAEWTSFSMRELKRSRPYRDLDRISL